MKNVAASLVVWLFGIGLLLFIVQIATGTIWGFVKSPTTGICYETHGAWTGFTAWESMSPVDDSYCEGE